MFIAEISKVNEANNDFIAGQHMYAGIAGNDCHLAADTLNIYCDLETIFAPLRTHPRSKPNCKLSLLAQKRDYPVLQAIRDSKTCNLGEIFAVPNQRRFVRVGSSSRQCYADLLLGEEAVIEIANGEMLILQPGLLSYYAPMAFFWLVDQDQCFIWIHSAVLAINEQAIVLVGPSKCGKSTLSYALQESGAIYYGDELAIFLPPNYELYPWSRPICLRPGGHDALGSPLVSPEWYQIKPNDPKFKVTVPEPTQPCPRDKANFFFLDGFTDKPKLSLMPGGEATRRLLQGMSCAEQSIGGRLEIAADLVNRYPCYRLAVGPPHETAALLMAHMRGQG